MGDKESTFGGFGKGSGRFGNAENDVFCGIGGDLEGTRDLVKLVLPSRQY